MKHLLAAAALAATMATPLAAQTYSQNENTIANYTTFIEIGTKCGFGFEAEKFAIFALVYANALDALPHGGIAPHAERGRATAEALAAGVGGWPSFCYQSHPTQLNYALGIDLFEDGDGTVSRAD